MNVTLADRALMDAQRTADGMLAQGTLEDGTEVQVLVSGTMRPWQRSAQVVMPDGTLRPAVLHHRDALRDQYNLTLVED